MNSRPTITIGIPFLNARATLADAVRSVFAQTCDDWELILIDDGSSDGSLELVRSIEDSRLQVVSDGARKGLPTRLNQIAEMAGGKYLARMDADDIMHPLRLERQVQFLESNPLVDVMDTATYTIDEHNAVIGIRGTKPLDCRPRAILRKGLFTHPTVTGRTAWFRKNPYDPRFLRSQDHELWSRSCAHTTFGRLQEPLFFYRESLAGNLRNYLQGSRTVRKIIRNYGPTKVGWCWTGLTIAESYMKSARYWACAKLGLQDRLIRMRTQPLDAHQTEEARAVIRQILATEVPGLSSAGCVLAAC